MLCRLDARSHHSRRRCARTCELGNQSQLDEAIPVRRLFRFADLHSHPASFLVDEVILNESINPWRRKRGERELTMQDIQPPTSEYPEPNK